MRAPLAGFALLAVVLGGCTGIPTSSSPEVIGSGGLETANPPPVRPPAGAQPREIVLDFLNENADSGDASHTAARQYLTPAANAVWSDDKVTVLDQASVGTTNRSHAVSVSGSRLGTIDANGVFTPVQTGDGSGVSNAANPFQFQTTLVKVANYAKPQWRISKLQSGLIVDPLSFQTQFQQRAIYYYDSAELHLVPDPHYTQLLEPDSLSNWLIRTLATGPPDGLSSELPANTDPSRVSVTVEANLARPVQVAIPGASQLDSATRLHLAVEVAATLSQVASIGTAREISLLDGTTPITVKGHGTTFKAGDFANVISPDRSTPQLYYIDSGGGVVNGAGQPLPGRLGAGYYDLISVALASDPNADGLLVAGTRVSHGVETLDVGREGSTLEPVPKVTGLLSRPDWAPDAQEVWIGAGPKLYRVSEIGKATAVPLAAAGGGQVAGRIVAVRLSPEGSRIALVLDGTDREGHAAVQIWIGVVVRGSDGVKVQGLTPITPTGVVITDVSWNDALKLFVIGHDRATGVAGIFEVQCDGSRWSAKETGGLPGPAQSITVGGGQVAVVSAAGTIWEQNGDSWQSPQGEETEGTAPIYVQ